MTGGKGSNLLQKKVFQNFFRNLFKLFFFSILLLQPMGVFIANYGSENCDDKAVHYYSAAMLYSTPQVSRDAQNFFTKFLEQEESEAGKSRLLGRLWGWRNYVVSDTLIKTIRDIRKGHFSDSSDSTSYGQIVKFSFLIMCLISIGYLLLVCKTIPLGCWTLLLALNIVALRVISIPFVMPFPFQDMHPFTSYVPRGSATLFVPALLLAMASDKKLAFSVGCILLLCWHAGFSVMVSFILLSMVLLVRFFPKNQVIEKLNASLHKRNFYVFILVISMLLVLILNVQNLPSEVVRHRLNEIVTVSKLFMLVAISVFSAAMIGIFAVVVFKLRLLPDEKILLNFFVINILFLVLSHLYIALTQILGWSFDSHFLMREIPNRLTGVQYLVFIICIVFFLQPIITKALKNNAYANKIPTMVLMMSLLIIGTWIYYYRTAFFDVPRIVRNFFAKEDCVFEDVYMTDLNQLNPKSEPEFFYSLAEYLFEKSEKKL